jgi:outer membrane protein assembly factor BamC
VVKRPADQLWDPVRDFWQENGFLLALDQANLGIMETDWAENRAKLPQDFIRNALGKVLTRCIPPASATVPHPARAHAAGGTEIYISHRGMIEVYPYNNPRRTRPRSGSRARPTPSWRPNSCAA